MKTSSYTEVQIIAILRHAEGGVPVAELCRGHGMSNASFYKWRAKYGGMPSEPRRVCRRLIDLSYTAMASVSIAA